MTSDVFTVNAGTESVDLWPVIGGELPFFKALKGLFVTTTAYRRKLKVHDEKEFLEQWLVLDLTAASNRGIPDRYYVWDQKIYVTPPPSVSLDLKADYHRSSSTALE
jgi:hypothetical protein